jgi:fatty acid desaturase
VPFESHPGQLQLHTVSSNKQRQSALPRDAIAACSAAAALAVAIAAVAAGAAFAAAVAAIAVLVLCILVTTMIVNCYFAMSKIGKVNQ